MASPTLPEFLEKARPLNPGVSDDDLTGFWSSHYPQSQPDSQSQPASLPTLSQFLAKAKPLNPEVPESELTAFWKKTYEPHGALEQPRSTIAEVGRQIVAGTVVDLPRMAGQAGRAVGLPTDVMAADAQLREVGWLPDLTGRSEISKAFIRGGRSLAPSLATMAAYFNPFGAVTGPLATVALFGGSQYQDEYDKVLAAGGTEEDARNAGLITGMIQGGGEVLANYLGLRALGLGRKVLGEGTQALLGKSVDTSVVKPWLKATGQAVVGEAATEAGQDVATAKVERSYGLETDSLSNIAFESGGAAAAMTLLLAPLGLHGHYRASKRAEAIDQILADPQKASPEDRAKVVQMLAAEGQDLKLPDAAAWKAQALQDVVAGRPIRREVMPPETADPAEKIMKSPTVDGAIQEASKALEEVTPEALDRAMSQQDLPTEPTEPVAPQPKLQYVGIQLGSGQTPAFELWTLLEPAEGLTQNSTYSRQTLEQAGIQVPAVPVSPKPPVSASVETAMPSEGLPPVEPLQPVPVPPIGPPSLKTVEDIHALADQKGIPWDDDPAFMDLTKSVTGKRRLDHLTGQERQRVYDALVTKPSIQPSRPSPSPELENAASAAPRPQSAAESGTAFSPVVQAYLDRQKPEMRGYFEGKLKGFQPNAQVVSGDQLLPVKVISWVDKKTAMVEMPARNVERLENAPVKLQRIQGQPLPQYQKEATVKSDNPAVSQPRHELPEAQNENLAARADAAHELVAQGEPGKRIFTDNPNAPGQTVTGQASTYPPFYGSLRMRKETVLKALEKIQKDQGLDVGPTVEKVKAALIDDATLDQIVGEFPGLAEEVEAIKGTPYLQPSGRKSPGQTSLLGDEPIPEKPAKAVKPEQSSLPMDIPVEVGQRPIIGRDVEPGSPEAPLFSKAAQTPDTEQTALTPEVLPPDEALPTTTKIADEREGLDALAKAMTGADRPVPPAGLQEYAKNVVRTSAVKRITLVGSVAAKGTGNDIDLIYDFGRVILPADHAKAEARVEKLLEASPIDLDKYDTFIQADGRYFHVSTGAGRQVIENTGYAKSQQGKPSRDLADKSWPDLNPQQFSIPTEKLTPKERALRERGQRRAANAAAAVEEERTAKGAESVAREPDLSTVEGRKAEIARLRREHAKALSVPLASEGGVSPVQIGRMSKRQNEEWSRLAQERMIVESRIRELSRSDAQIAAAEKRETDEQNKTRLAVLGRRIEDLSRVGMGKSGKIRPTYQAEIDKATIERDDLLGRQTVPPLAQPTGPAKHAPTFYSQAEKVLQQKMPNKASAEQIRGILSPNNGVKPDELKWLGVDDLLKTKDAFTKEEVLAFVQANQVEIREVMNGRVEIEVEKEALRKELAGRGVTVEITPNGMPGEVDVYHYDNPIEPEDIESGDLADLAPTIDRYAELLHPREDTPEGSNTKFASYQLPGGTNYRELLLTLPHRETFEQWYVRQIEKPTKTAETLRSSERDYWKRIYRDALPAQGFHSSHWSERNILAHVRFNDRWASADGTTYTPSRKVLFLEEIQSDWHQLGKRKGYRRDVPQAEFDAAHDEQLKHREQAYAVLNRLDDLGFDRRNDALSAIVENDDYAEVWDVPSDDRPALDGWKAAYKAWESLKREASASGVPDAPFKKTWHEMSLRRMLRYAAENGYDSMAWTTGEQQNERYDLSKQIDSIDYLKEGETYTIHAIKDGRRVIEKNDMVASQLSDVVGKEVAEKILAGGGRKTIMRFGQNVLDGKKLSGLDLKVGGEGMKGFYDEILPAYLNKYGKKWGATVRTIDLGGVNQDAAPTFDKDTGKDIWPSLVVHALPITDAMRKSVMSEGQPLFQASGKSEPKSIDYRAPSELLLEASSFVPAESVSKAGDHWRYTTIQGTEHPATYPTKTTAIEAAKRHQAAKLEAIQSEAFTRVIARREGETVDPLLKPNTRRKLSKALVDFEAGELTSQELAQRIDDLHSTLELKRYEKLYGRPPKVRGALLIREKLLQAVRRGDLPREQLDLTEWFLKGNEHLVERLGISVKVPVQGQAGSYDPLTRIMTLMKGTERKDTAVHEILHHLERLMPTEYQEAIRKEWTKQITKKLSTSKGDEKAYLHAVLKANLTNDLKDWTDAQDFINDGKVPYDLYNLMNASEFWAVNGTTILGRRHTGVWGQIKQWMKEAVERIKGFLGLDSQAPVLKALAWLQTESTGKELSKKMLAQARVYIPGSMEAADAVERPEEVTPFAQPEGQTSMLPAPDTSRQQQLYPKTLEADAKGGPARGIERMGKLTEDQHTALRHVHGTPEAWAEKLNAFKATWKSELIQGLFDHFAPILNYSKQGYLLARLSKGGDGTLEALLMYGKPYVDKEGAYRVEYDKKEGINGFAKVLAGLQGEQDRFLEWVAAHRASRLKELGLENLYSDADIAALKSLSSGKMPDGTSRPQVYLKTLEALNDWNLSILRIAMDSGLINRETMELYKHTPYVPFYRLQEDETSPAFRMTPGMVNQYAWKKLKGGTAHLNDDLLANLLQNWSHLITASAKNRAARATLQAAVQAGVAERVSDSGKGTVSYREGGKDLTFSIDDPALLEAVSALHYAGLGAISKPFATMKRWLTFGVTVNPAFKIRNLLRDSLQVIATSDISYNPLKNIGQGWEATAKESETRAQMLAGGGMIRFGAMLDGTNADRTRRLIETGVKPEHILSNQQTLQRFWASKVMPAFEAYQELGDRGEQVNRAALYEQLLEQGVSHAEASFLARDLMDFSLMGKWEAIRILTQVVPFMNARLQGIYKLGRAGKDDYKRMGTVLGAVSIASIALLLYNEDDDDWKKLEDWDRDNFWWFKVGGFAFRLPKPFEIGAIGTIAERSVELFRNDEMTKGRFGERLRDIVFSQLNMNPTPQLLKPLMDLYANKDSFTGQPIETLGMDRLRKEDRMTERTSELAKVFGQLGLPDPTQLAMGRWNTLSPVQIDALVHGYFSWLGSAVTTALDYGIRPIVNHGAKPAMRLKDVFLAGNFVETLPTNQSRYVTQLYEQAKEIEEAYGSYRDAIAKGDREKAQSIREEEKDKIAKYPMAEAVKGQEAILSRQMRRIESDPKLSADEKREQLDKLAQRKHQVAQRLGQRLVAP